MRSVPSLTEGMTESSARSYAKPAPALDAGSKPGLAPPKRLLPSRALPCGHVNGLNGEASDSAQREAAGRSKRRVLNPQALGQRIRRDRPPAAPSRVRTPPKREFDR